MVKTCVYCLQEKEFVRGKRNGDFNSEHVVPQALASVRNSLTLIGIVCSECNSSLGSEIDRNFTQGTIEGLQRFIEKQKPIEKVGELDRRKVQISLARASDQSIHNAKIDLTHENGELKQRFAVQLCIKLKNSDEWLVIQRADFPVFAAKNPELDFSDLKILGPSPATEEFFQQEILKVWPNLQIIGDIAEEEHITDVIVDYGLTEKRAIAKIAFNYFCYITQDSPERARSEEFDAIRKYIRYGQEPDWEVVLPRDQPILSGDTSNWRQTNGHLVAFDRERNRLREKSKR